MRFRWGHKRHIAKLQIHRHASRPKCSLPEGPNLLLQPARCARPVRVARDREFHKVLFGREAIMAGKIQLAAKLLLGTTMLASSAGGVYYASTHGWSLLSASRNTKTSAELDAVASAWTESTSRHASEPSKSSATARSAEATMPESAPKAKPASDDRYALPTNSKIFETQATEDAKKSDDASRKQHRNSVAEVAAKADATPIDSPAKSKSGAHEPTPVLATPVAQDNKTELARGQEPKDDAPAAVQVKDIPQDISGALDQVAQDPKANSAIKEPKQITPPAQQTNIADASRRAKQAFGNGAPAASGDRYGATMQPSADSGARPKAAINPFGSPASSGNPPNNLTTDSIQPLSANPNEIGTPPRDFPQRGDNLRPLDANQSSRTANRDNPPRGRMGQTIPSGNMPQNAGISPFPSNRTGTLPSGMDGPGQPLGGDGTGKPGEKALEGPQQPMLSIQKFAPGEIQVGKPAKFVLHVKNAGNQVAENVTIQDEIPQGTQLISTSPNATPDGSRLIWQLGKLSAGEDRTVEMQIMPKAEGDIGSVATVTYSAQASVKTHCTMPQLAIRMTAPSEVMVGQQQHVKIEIRNPGSGDATGVMLFENVPANVKHVAGPALEFEIGTLRAGETRELDLVLTAEKAGKVTNAITARAQGNLQVQQQMEFEVIAPALAVAVQGPERRYLERPATYEVSVQNPGTAAAHDVQIVTKLPKGMRFVKANNMGEYDASTHAVYWSLAELPKGERGTVELVAMPIETGTQTLQVESRAQQGLTDKTQRDVLVEGLAAIKFEVRALEDPIEVGRETGYEIRVINQGTKAATNVQITATLPAGLKLVSAEGETQHRIDQGRLVFEPLQQLAPKADTVYHVRAQGIQAGDQRIVVEVKTDDMEHPIRREESTRVFGDQ
jgi:uncharacterized repeat protein (TIGR01451 family)